MVDEYSLLLRQCKDELATRFIGWADDYHGLSTVAVEPQPSVFSDEVQRYEGSDCTSLQEHLEDLIALALLLSCEPCMYWTASCPKTRERWDPLVQSYQDFKSSHPEVEAYVYPRPATRQVAKTQQLLGFFISRELTAKAA